MFAVAVRVALFSGLALAGVVGAAVAAARRKKAGQNGNERRETRDGNGRREMGMTTCVPSCNEKSVDLLELECQHRFHPVCLVATWVDVNTASVEQNPKCCHCQRVISESDKRKVVKKIESETNMKKKK